MANVAGLLVVLGLAPASNLAAQDAQDPPVWVVTSIKVPPAELEDCLAAWNRVLTPMEDELESRGLMVDQVILQHFYADEWNVVRLRKYPDWNSVAAAGDAQDEIQQEMYSEEEWETYQSEIEACTPDFHRDQIYSEYIPPPAGSE